MSWGVVAGAAASVVGGAVSAKGAKSAAGKAAAGSEREIAFQRESRDIARGDVAPQRAAGYTALDAMMSMTGLGGGVGGQNAYADYYQGEADKAGRIESSSELDYVNAFKDTLGKSGRRKVDKFLQQNPFSSYQSDDGQSYMSALSNTLKGTGRKKIRRFTESNPFETFEGRNYGGAIYGKNYGGGVYGRAYGGGVGPGARYNVNESGPETVYGGGVGVRNPNPQTIQPAQDGYVQPNKDERNFPSQPRPEDGAIEGDYIAAGEGGYQPPQENPGGVEGGFNFMTDPGYEFRMGEGMRALERSAAARGGLMSGGFARKATRYAQDYASNEYSNVYNRIARIADIGSGAASGSAGYAMEAGRGMGTAAAQGGYAQAGGVQGQYNAWGNAANELGKIDWSNVFNRPNSGSGGGGGATATGGWMG